MLPHVTALQHNAPHCCAGRRMKCHYQGRTDNSWGPRAIGDHGSPVFLAHTQKKL
ncbi:unnamed protein product [Staurois parvus]|uniref:Uncharacterized protein n=1 Tax=Staurois parvus TaxID=386267 RepID=A0ABN9GIS1_9NEOB|nr:unnamed protein product [Staurois parvus]